jgi:hypothetical protein
LCEFANHNSNLPNKLVVYRAGVDDKLFQKVLDTELPAIQQACKGKIVFLFIKQKDLSLK